MCETYPNHAGRLFATFLKGAPLKYDLVKVDRERKNVDLWLEYSGGEQLIVENKVKSTPVRPQLEKYTAAIQNKTQIGFLLLSLARPTFLSQGETTIPLSDGEAWHYLSYGDLAKKLSGLVPAIGAINGYHSQLLEDYVDLITHLDTIQAYFIINWDGTDSDFFGFQQEIKELKSIRIHDLIDKMRYSQVAQRVHDVLSKENFALYTGDIRHGPCGQVWVMAGMAHGVALVDFKYFLMDDDRFGKLILGVQVQGNDFRLVVEVLKGGCTHKIADALFQPKVGNKVWFNFASLPNRSEEFPKKRRYNKYGDVFCYRSKRLSGMVPQRLVDTIVDYARLIKENAPLLRRQIESVL